MKKKVFSKLLMVALVATVGAFTSCKDYDDDINDLRSQINGLETSLTTLVNDKVTTVSQKVTQLEQQLKEVDPETYESIDLANGHRIVRALEVSLYTGKPYSSFKTHSFKERDFEIVKTGLDMPREQLYERINARVLKMMDAGLEEEARRMLPYRDLPALQTVGYKELFDCFDGTIDLDEAVRRIQVDTRHYAKRQLTWWRRDKSIRWISI